MSEDKRMTRQVRVYEETARFIDAVVRNNPQLKFADVVEMWAKSWDAEAYSAVKASGQEIDEMINRKLGND